MSTCEQTDWAGMGGGGMEGGGTPQNSSSPLPVEDFAQAALTKMDRWSRVEDFCTVLLQQMHFHQLLILLFLSILWLEHTRVVSSFEFVCFLVSVSSPQTIPVLRLLFVTLIINHWNGRQWLSLCIAWGMEGGRFTTHVGIDNGTRWWREPGLTAFVLRRWARHQSPVWYHGKKCHLKDHKRIKMQFKEEAKSVNAPVLTSGVVRIQSKIQSGLIVLSPVIVSTGF